MGLIEERNSGTGIALAFVGLVVPDRPQYRSVAFSRAGNMFQTNLLTAIGFRRHPGIDSHFANSR